MKIWHVGASSSPFRVDGVSRTVWLLSREQARLGHDVSLLIDTAPDDAALQVARDARMNLIHVDATYLSYGSQIRQLLQAHSPDVVHMHSVFVVRQATLGKILNRCGIPYVITPHGGLAPQVLLRGVFKKSVYAMLRERPRFMGSSAVALVTPAEERPVRSFLPHYKSPIRWMPNPVEIENLEPHRWQGLRDPRRLVFLGRFDVLVKGIDILIEIARLLPEVKVDLYGTEDPKTRDWLIRLKQNLPPNITFNDPIFGIDKARMLSGASLYIQPSRWEGFPVSVAECLFIGVPSAVADTLDLAQLVYQHNLGLVLPLDPPRAAEQIRAAMADESRLHEWSQRGREFAVRHFHPSAVAANHIRLYQEVIDLNARATAHEAVELNYPTVIRAGVSRNGHLRHLGAGLVSARLRGAIKNSVSRVFERSEHVLRYQSLPRTVVLCYHSINDNAADLSIDPAALRVQLQRLQEWGYEFMNFGDLVYRIMRWGPPRNDVACITFDDGYEDNFTHAAPLLREMNIPATIFVTTGLMMRDPAVLEQFQELTRYSTNYLTPSQVNELSRNGFEIGAHTHTHPNMARLSPECTRFEVTHSKELLEQTISQRVRSFAYPFGKRAIHYTPATISVVRESEFSGAAAVAFRSVTARNAIRVFEIPRFFITRDDSPINFQQKVAGHFDWLGTVQESTPAWLKAAVSPEDRY